MLKILSILKCFIILIFLLGLKTPVNSQIRPRVFVLTDINLVGGDPDDRQSLIHLFWYANELDIVGIVPDYWNGKGDEACMETIRAYEKDYNRYNFSSQGYPKPSDLSTTFLFTEELAIPGLIKAASSSETPLYVLIWGSMQTLKKALFQAPDISEKIRVLTIGTGRKYGPKDEVPGEDCQMSNWNGKGRDEIYNDPRFDEMWWLESNWTYNGMFVGDGPKEMFNKLAKFGAMGQQIVDVTKNHKWAQYFRVGDTPTVTYMIDNGHNQNRPEQQSWARLFKQPFPEQKPNYYTDDNGPIYWNYNDPCKTWNLKSEMYEYNKSTLVKERDEMYEELLMKLSNLYN